jgi:protease I
VPKNKKVAIMIAEQYQVTEVWYPYYRFKEAGIDCDFIAVEANRDYPLKEGYPCRSTIAAKNARASDYDCLLIPGGFAPDFMRRSDDMIKFANEMVNADKIIASICHGAWLLCSTGILKGKTVTCYMAVRDDVKNAGANYIDKECVVDGNLITARKPDDLPAFCKAVLKALGK